jgi:hypothetical protein
MPAGRLDWPYLIKWIPALHGYRPLTSVPGDVLEKLGRWDEGEFARGDNDAELTRTRLAQYRASRNSLEGTAAP